MRFCVLGTMPFVVQAGAENLPWVKAILAKEAEHASKPEGIGVGHWTAEEDGSSGVGVTWTVWDLSQAAPAASTTAAMVVTTAAETAAGTAEVVKATLKAGAAEATATAEVVAAARAMVLARK